MVTQDNKHYKICRKCVLDTSDPDIKFNSQGICNHCLEYERLANMYLFRDNPGVLKVLINEIKQAGKGKEFDCIIGLSGGVDSTYTAYKTKEMGLTPLAIHVDTGWNSETSVSNIESLVKKLNLDLFTYVIDWEEMKDLQLSFFKASLANCDIPQDHAFMAVLYKVAAKHGIRYIISGHNLATEAIMPKAWGYTSTDWKHIVSIQSKFGSKKLKNFPHYGFFEYFLYYPYIRRIKLIQILNYLPYDKKQTTEFVKKELGFRDYGSKHHESVFTRFFQAYYLPMKFGYDKRKAHLSNLILSGQISRAEALAEINKDVYPPNKLKEDMDFVIKKIGLSLIEFEEIMALPVKTFRDYSSNYELYKLKNFMTSVVKDCLGKELFRKFIKKY